MKTDKNRLIDLPWTNRDFFRFFENFLTVNFFLKFFFLVEEFFYYFKDTGEGLRASKVFNFEDTQCLRVILVVDKMLHSIEVALLLLMWLY